MAGAALRRGEALVWLPPRSVAEGVLQRGEAGLLAWRSLDGREPPHVDRVSLDGLLGTSQVSVLLDPRDVTLLTPVLPALSAARLQQALPHVVEDALLQDVAACALVAGPELDHGRRLVAVIDRAWLERVAQAFEQRGMRVRAVWPAHMALPVQPGAWSLVCLNDVLALRTGAAAGFGWAAGLDAAERQAGLSAALELALAEHGHPESLSVWIDDAAWSEPLQAVLGVLGCPVSIGALPAMAVAPDALNLLTARASKGRRMWAAFEPRAWRWPARLVLACLGAGVLGLNLHWAQLVRERAELKRALEAGFRGAFPEAQVVVDPLLQMTRRLAEMRAQAGQRAPDDWLPLMARLAQALGDSGLAAVQSLEYRDAGLVVRFQGGLIEHESARARLQEDAERAGLRVQFDAAAEPLARIDLRL